MFCALFIKLTAGKGFLNISFHRNININIKVVATFPFNSSVFGPNSNTSCTVSLHLSNVERVGAHDLSTSPKPLSMYRQR